MADDNVNVNQAAVNDGDDTVTRKTIRLRPMPAAASRPQTPPAAAATPAVPSASAPAADDSGDDTKTRRTIKLKPISAKPPVSGAVPPPPVAKAAPAAPAPAPAPASAATPASGDGEDTVTRKTLVLKPINAAKPAAPEAKPAAASPAPGASDNTVKLQRPAPKPLTPPPAPKSLTPPPAPKPLTPPPAAKPLTPPPAPVAPKENAASKIAATETQSGDSPSMLYLIVAAVSLICLIYSTLLITVQFLDLTQGQKVEENIPAFMLPKAK